MDVLYRRIDDDFIDPEVFRPDSLLGVKGLIGVYKAGRIALANAPGTGIADDKVIYAYVPEIIKYYTGEEAILPNVPTYICRDDKDRAYVLAHLDQLVVKAANESGGYGMLIGPHATEAERTAFAAKITAEPRNYMAQPTISLSRVPTIVDDSSDPFALRRETATGVAGFIQVSREQNIDIVNLIGSGLLDTPALAVFLPSLCRQLMGEDLLLANHPSWWCGNAEGLNQIMANPAQLAVGPSMDRSAAPVSPAALMEAIQAVPHAFMARAPVCPAAVPAWDQGSVSARCTLLRVFACATDQGFAVMPGGLAITAPDVATLTDDCPERQQSKDIWVLSDQPVEPFSLMGGLQAVAELRRSSDLPSRIADHLLWIGRYLERAEGLVRLLRSVFRRLSGEARPSDIPELPFFLNFLKAETIMTYRSRYRTAFQLAPVLDLLLVDEGNPESLAFQFSQLAAHVEHLPRQSDRRFASPEERIALEMLTAVRLLDLSGLRCSEGGAHTESLAAFLESMETRLKDFAQQISAHYLSRVPATPHFSMIPGNRQP